MATYRVSHTATLLRNGRVLMAGGSDDSSAEIYDPKTGTFSPTGSMTDVRSGHTATLLADGRVLIAGGSTHAESYSATSAEIYDPVTGTFSPTGAMATARMGHTATLLPDGRVLVTGGSNGTEGAVPTNEIVATAELYDPRTGTFSPTGSMATARGAHTATLLPDGRVLVAGGGSRRVAGQRDANDPVEVVASAEIYDPRTGTFSPTGAMATGRAVHTATLLPDGHVLMAGGSEVFASAETYDPTTGTFSGTGAMAVQQFSHTATLLADGRVLMAGGSEVFASAEIYDPTTGDFGPTKP
jgi:WD40 repeat protein